MDSPLPLPHPSIPEFSRSREELSVLVQRDGHDSIGRVEGFLDSVSVVNVDVDVEDSFVVPEEFEDSEDDVYEEERTSGSCWRWMGSKGELDEGKKDEGGEDVRGRTVDVTEP